MEAILDDNGLIEYTRHMLKSHQIIMSITFLSGRKMYQRQGL